MAHILIVDDEKDIRLLVSTILKSNGHSTTEAETGEEGLAKISESNPDLIISDISMPGMTGFEFLGELRKDPATASVPLIFITGVKEENIMRRGMELGADDFLEKPFSAQDLLSAISTRLRMREMLTRSSEEKLEQLRQSISLSLPHELRTPLNVILAFSQIIVEDAGELKEDELTKFGTSIHHAGTRLHRLIENYLLYADTEIAFSDEKKLAELSASVTENADTVLRSYATDKAKDYDRTADLAFDVESLPLRIEHDHLARIVSEIVDNALKFSPKGRPVRVSLRRSGSMNELKVADEGVGMSPEHLKELGAFVQFDRKVREQQGTGLGLAITRRLVQLYGGDVTVESNPNNGTTVTITLSDASA